MQINKLPIVITLISCSDNEIINPAIRNAIRNDDGTEEILLHPVYRKLCNVLKKIEKNIRKKVIKNS